MKIKLNLLIIIIFLLALVFNQCVNKNDNKKPDIDKDITLQENILNNKLNTEKYEFSTEDKIILPDKLNSNVSLALINEVDEVFDDLLNEIVSSFNKEYNNITISIFKPKNINRIHLNPFSVSEESFDDYVDILITTPYNLYEWHDMAYILPVSLLDFDFTNFFDNTINNIILDSKVLGIPLFAHKLQLLFYNKEYVKGVPDSLDKLNEYVNKSAIKNNIIPFAYTGTNPLHLIPFIFETDFTELNSIKDIVDLINKAITKIRNLKHNSILPLFDLSSDKEDLLFRERKIAFIVNGDWCIKPYTNILEDNLGISFVPPMKEGEEFPSFFSEVKYIFVSSTIKYDKERLLAVYKFIKYLTSERIQKYIMDNSELTSPLNTLLDNPTRLDIEQNELAMIKAFSNSIVFNDKFYKETIFKLIKKYIIPLLRKKNIFLTQDIIKEHDLKDFVNYILKRY